MLNQPPSLESYEEIRERLNLAKRDPEVYWLYNYGRRLEDGRLSYWDRDERGEGLWEHAEEFPDRLDMATNGRGSALGKRYAEILARAPSFRKLKTNTSTTKMVKTRDFV